MPEILTWLLAQSWFWPAVGGLLLFVFRDNPAIKPIIEWLLNLLAPKTQPALIETVAIGHYTALCKCCENCPDAIKALKSVWPHLEPGHVHAEGK